MAILDDVKAAVRIAATTTAFNSELNDLIAAAQADLALAGIVVTDITDPLYKRAVVTYCKAYFGYDNPDADRLIQAYVMIKTHMSLSNEYRAYAITFTVTTSTGAKVDGATIEIEGEAISLETNSQGVAVYYATAKNVDVHYAVSMSGYKTVEGSVYVDGIMTVGVVLSAA